MNRTTSTGQTPRDKSPQPLRSPSPDYVARTAIFSTKSPSSAEIAHIAGLTPPKNQRIPLLEEIAELRKYNKELQERLTRPGTAGGALVRTVSHTGDNRDHIAGLLEQLRLKDLELAELKRAQANLPTLAQSDEGSRYSPAKKFSLIKSESQQAREMNEQIKQLTEENEALRKSARESKSSSGGQGAAQTATQQDQFARRIRELERNNDDLKAYLARAQKLDGSREGKQLLDMFKTGEPEPDTSKTMAQVQRIKMEFERNLEEFKIKMSHRLHYMEQRILEITKKQSDIVTMVNTRKRYAKLSEGRSSFYGRDTFEAQPILIEDRPKFEDRYSTPNRQQQATVGKQESTAPVKGTASSGQYQADQLNQQLLQEQSLTNQLRRQLYSKSSDYERLSTFTEHLKNEIDTLNRQLLKVPRGPVAPVPLISSPDGSQSSSRVERYNYQLRTQVITINNFVDQLKREKSQQEEDIKGLTDTIVELRNTIVDLRGQLTREIGRGKESGKYPTREPNFTMRASQSFNEEDYIQLQSDNRTLRQTLEALRNSHSELLSQLERVRRYQVNQQASSTGQRLETKPSASSYQPPAQTAPTTFPSVFPTTVNDSQQTYSQSFEQKPLYIPPQEYLVPKPPSYTPPTTTYIPAYVPTYPPSPSYTPPPPSSEAKPAAYQPNPSSAGFDGISSVPPPPAPASTDLTYKNIELQQLRAEVSRLKATNEMIQRYKNELERNNRGDVVPLRRTNTTDLSQAADDLARYRERASLRERDYQNLKLTFDRVNSEMMQIPLLKEQAQKERGDAERYKRIAEYNSLDLSILRREKYALQAQLRDYAEMKKRSEDTESLLKYRDDEITHLRKPYRSVEFDSIMQELQVVRQELERIKLEEIPKDTAALVQNIRQLLAEKTTILKSIRKSQSEYSSLTSEVARLKRECLDLNSKYTSEREENQRLKLQLESARSESLTYQREVNRLKDLIAEYVAKDDVQQLSETITSEEERQLVASEEYAVRISQSYEVSISHELDNVKSCCQYARLKLENITDKIVQYLARPREPAP